MIAQVDEKEKIGVLEELTKILTFCQGNKFAHSSSILVMLVAEKEPMNWVAWFYQKLQNELVTIQLKVGKSISTLVGPALTIIGYYYQELFVKE